LRKYFAPLPMPSLADKLAAYDYVKAHVGEDLLPSVVWVGDSISELLAGKPRAGRFVLKASHGWNFKMFLDLPDDLLAKQDDIETQTTQWLRSRFGYAWGEWQYCTFKPRLFLESFIDFNQGDTPDDFKFYCFDGKVCLVEIGVDRFTRLGTAFYDPSWKQFPVGYKYEPIQYERPDNLNEMIAVAETIAKGMEFARIDLYSDCMRNIKFGEVTFTPGNACSRFTRAGSDGGRTMDRLRPADLEFDKWLGSFFRKIQSSAQLEVNYSARQEHLVGESGVTGGALAF
jgi:TupA-like ATPgrasp